MILQKAYSSILNVLCSSNSSWSLETGEEKSTAQEINNTVINPTKLKNRKGMPVFTPKTGRYPRVAVSKRLNIVPD